MKQQPILSGISKACAYNDTIILYIFKDASQIYLHDRIKSGAEMNFLMSDMLLWYLCSHNKL